MFVRSFIYFCLVKLGLQRYRFLSYLLLARCNIGVQLSVRSFGRPSVRPQFASSLVSRSSDFVNILRQVWKIYVESRNKVHFSFGA